MIKIVMIYDQVQSGQGTKDDRMVPLSGTRSVIGPAIMMKPFLKELEEKVIACLTCGTGTYEENPEEVTRKLCAMAIKLNPDVVICGPSFNYPDYSNMCAKLAMDIRVKTGIPAVAAMSEENAAVIKEYKKKLPIVKVPKKGDGGLNTALKNLCLAAQAAARKEEKDLAERKICY